MKRDAKDQYFLIEAQSNIKNDHETDLHGHEKDAKDQYFLIEAQSNIKK